MTAFSDPEVGMAVPDILGDSAEILSTSGLRGQQVSAALSNAGLNVTLSAPGNDLAASFHKVGTPEQVARRPSVQPVLAPAQTLTT